MAYPMVFFSFVALQGDRSDHRRYNEWHQLDHRPENLALPGVAWGDRWARTKAGSQASAEYMDVDYIAMYWFNEPLDRAVQEWNDLSTHSFQWGRGPMLPGLHLTLTRFAEAYSDATHDHHLWEDRTLIPELLGIEGVAGAWTFAFDHHQQHSSMPLTTTSPDEPGRLRMRLVYIDGEPAETTERIRATVKQATGTLSRAAASGNEVLLETEVTTIIPWQDW